MKSHIELTNKSNPSTVYVLPVAGMHVRCERHNDATTTTYISWPGLHGEVLAVRENWKVILDSIRGI